MTTNDCFCYDKDFVLRSLFPNQSERAKYERGFHFISFQLFKNTFPTTTTTKKHYAETKKIQAGKKKQT